MLILTRKDHQSIQIGDDIRIYVLERRGSKTRVGIEAPKDAPIWRDEIIPSETADCQTNNLADQN